MAQQINLKKVYEQLRKIEMSMITRDDEHSLILGQCLKDRFV